MGLMQGAEEELMLRSEVSYCFLHLTLQEYLAALYWSKLDSMETTRVVSESDLFPLTTLVSEGIEEKSGFHWPALFFLAGLTKLMSVPLDLLKASLIVRDEVVIDDSDDDDLDPTVHLSPWKEVETAILISFSCCLKPIPAIWLPRFLPNKIFILLFQLHLKA